MLRAAAGNYWEQGIEGIYISRGWFYNYPYDGSFYEKIREIPAARRDGPEGQILQSSHARRWPKAGERTGKRHAAARDARGRDIPVPIDFTISDDLPRWDAVGRVHEVLLRIRITDTTELDRIGFELNGEALPDSALRIINQMFWMSGPRRVAQGYWFVYTLDRYSWPGFKERTRCRLRSWSGTRSPRPRLSCRMSSWRRST